MDDGSKPPLLALLILLGFSAFLAFAETAFASVSKNKIKSAAEHGDNRAEKALFALENFDNAITTVLICNNITSVTIATIVTVFVTRRWSVNAVSISTVITTIVIFFACEMLPKSLAKKYSYKITLSCATTLWVLMKVFKPFAYVLTKIGIFASKHVKEEEASITEDEIQDIIEDMAEEGSIDEEQKDLISNAVQFGDVKAESIVTPRVNLTAIDIDDKPQEIFEFIQNQTHSRLPVYRDSPDNIVGVLQVRKFMKQYLKTSKIPKIRPLLDKVCFAPCDIEIHDLLKLMSKHKINLAVIRDKFGGTMGIVTVEDILEELVGEIWDESDTVQEETKNRIEGIDLSKELETEHNGGNS